MFDSVTGSKGVREKLPTGVSTNTQWRRAGVKYGSNECFVDIVEKVDCITDKNGQLIFNEIRGEINCRTKLSGMPDLSLTFANPRVLDDVSFHPCVRLQSWTNSHLLSFIPPDGTFNLAKYILGPENQVSHPSHRPLAFPIPPAWPWLCRSAASDRPSNAPSRDRHPPPPPSAASHSVRQILVPLSVRPVITYTESGGKIDIEISAKQCAGKIIEDVVITMAMPKSVNSVNGTPSVGSQSFDQLDRIVRWDIKKLPGDRPSTLKGTISMTPNSPKPDNQPIITVRMPSPLPKYASPQHPCRFAIFVLAFLPPHRSYLLS